MQKLMTSTGGYGTLVGRLRELIEQSRRHAARSLNEILTATYWQIGRRIVEHEQAGSRRADYGDRLLERLSLDLVSRFGRGFGPAQLRTMRQFYLAYPRTRIRQSPIGESLPRPPIRQSAIGELPAFPLSWTHYTLLLRVEEPDARRFYESESLRGSWTVRQLDRQISTRFYERALLSRDKTAFLLRESRARRDGAEPPERAVRDPYVLEFLDLRDDYSESDLEEALVTHMQSFLLELGTEFAFVGRQVCLRIGGLCFKVDLVFFHRVLRCLVLVDLKLDAFSHADAGQMHTYLNYASEHWRFPGENPPVGIILCASKNDALVHYALHGLDNRILPATYRMHLPGRRKLLAELQAARRHIETRRLALPPPHASTVTVIPSPSRGIAPRRRARPVPAPG